MSNIRSLVQLAFEVLAVLVVALIIALGLGTIVWCVFGAVVSPTVTLVPCETEDSTNCYWDGGSNGQGRKFIDINGTQYFAE